MDKTFKIVFPQADTPAQELPKKFTEYRNAQKAPVLADIPKAEIHVATPVKGVKLSAKDVKVIHDIESSTSPLAEAITNQKALPEQIIGTLATALLTLEFVKIQGEFKKGVGEAKTEAEKKTLNAEWKEVINGFKKAYASMGLKVEEKDIQAFSVELSKDEKALASIINIANSRKSVKGPDKGMLDEKNPAMGRFETVLGRIDDDRIGNLILPRNLCLGFVSQGNIHKHIGESFSIEISGSYPCWIQTGRRWWQGHFGTCYGTHTLANLSYSMDLVIGYKVTCCTAEVWGSASANVCGSFAGTQYCASCTARITGAASVARVRTGSYCTYAIGMNAELKCTFAGITVLNVNYPIGYSLTGPCPPFPCPK